MEQLRAYYNTIEYAEVDNQSVPLACHTFPLETKIEFKEC